MPTESAVLPDAPRAEYVHFGCNSHPGGCGAADAPTDITFAARHLFVGMEDMYTCGFGWDFAIADAGVRRQHSMESAATVSAAAAANTQTVVCQLPQFPEGSVEEAQFEVRATLQLYGEPLPFLVEPTGQAFEIEGPKLSAIADFEAYDGQEAVTAVRHFVASGVGLEFSAVSSDEAVVNSGDIEVEVIRSVPGKHHEFEAVVHFTTQVPQWTDPRIATVTVEAVDDTGSKAIQTFSIGTQACDLTGLWTCTQAYSEGTSGFGGLDSGLGVMNGYCPVDQKARYEFHWGSQWAKFESDSCIFVNRPSRCPYHPCVAARSA